MRADQMTQSHLTLDSVIQCLTDARTDELFELIEEPDDGHNAVGGFVCATAGCSLLHNAYLSLSQTTTAKKNTKLSNDPFTDYCTFQFAKAFSSSKNYCCRSSV